MVDRVCDAKGGFFLIAINGGTRSIDEMVHRMMTASFQDCKKAHDIGINVVPRVINAVADAGLSRKVHDNFGGQLRKDPFHGVLITDIPFCKGKTRIIGKALQALLFQGHLIIGIEIIHAMNGIALRKKPQSKVIPYKASCTRNEYRHSFYFAIHRKRSFTDKIAKKDGYIFIIVQLPKKAPFPQTVT